MATGDDMSNPTPSGALPAGWSQAKAVPFDRPWQWLSAGWRDLWAAPGVSLFYGVLASLSGLLLSLGLAQAGLESLIPVLTGGFLLIGPLLAVGLYETSRLLAASERPTLVKSIAAGVRSAASWGPLGLMLFIIYLVWMRVAIVLVALFLGSSALPPAREILPMLLLTSNGLGLLVVGTAVGAALAGVVYATTVISIPMLMDQKTDLFTAVATSVSAVRTSLPAMLLWAALIVGLIAVGVATLGIGLVLVFPLIGHATWHAYRDLTGAN